MMPLSAGARPESIAIIGMGCRLPGGVNSPQAFWAMLASGECPIGEIPPQRWGINDFYHPEKDQPGKIYSREGAWLADIDQFDAAFFSISPREAKVMDPQQRLLAEVSWEA